MARHTLASLGFSLLTLYILAILAYQFLCFLFFGTTIPEPLEPGHRRGPYARSYGKNAHYGGWPGIDHLFIFGDSWTTTGFEIDQQQPTFENPFGNPEWDPKNWHLGAGSNWVGFITSVHNATMLRTVNLAYGGATVDMDLIHPFSEKPAGMQDLGYQIHELFKPTYQDHPDYFDWKEDNTLFIVWIGLNDIHNANEETAEKFGMVQETFRRDVDDLYQLGARNFMFMNIPPIERAPLAEVEDMVEDWTKWVAVWDRNLTSLAMNFTNTYQDATAFVFDTYKLFEAVIEDPCSHPETCAFKDTKTFCPEYAFGTDEWNSKSDECEYRVDEYLWMNDLHPTTRMQNLTALEMAKALTVPVWG